jgi:exodeoxyribonuclease-3
MNIDLVSWNVNGLRAVAKKGFGEWFTSASPDILCIQETKAHEEQLPATLRSPEGYAAYFAYPERKGYSGVATFSREEPEDVARSIPGATVPDEGRVLLSTYPWARLYNIYFPNGKQSAERLAYKMAFYGDLLRAVCRDVDEGYDVIICGDVNTAHTEDDIARPKENEAVSGFLPQERAWIDSLLGSGFVDTFRLFTRGGGHYSWWDYKSRARERNVGWRLDYFFVSESLKGRVTSADILSDVTGSDHCPVALSIEI